MNLDVAMFPYFCCGLVTLPFVSEVAACANDLAADPPRTVFQGCSEGGFTGAAFELVGGGAAALGAGTETLDLVPLPGA